MLFSQLVNSVCLAEDFFLSAEQVFKDDQNEIIKAKGSVQIQKGKIRATADSLVFNTKINQVKLKGNIQILSETDDLIFAEEATLNDSLKSGVIKNLGLLMSDGSRLAASSGNTQEMQSRSIYKNIVFTKCIECEEDKEVMWKLKAKKATHLKKSKIILYEHVFLEVLKIPLVYIPLFYHPDPTVKRKTGLLTPKISSSSVFGYSYEQPIYLNLSKRSDFTIKPKFTTKEGIILDNNYRKKFSTGEFDLRTSITKGTKVREGEPDKKEVRGHLDLKFANNINNNWLFGANVKRSSDKSYLYKYGISSGETLLTQYAFLEKGDMTKNISIEGYKFQSLSDDYLTENLPFIRPLIIYNWSNYNDRNRKRDKNIKFVSRSITKNDGDFTNAIHFEFQNSKKYLQKGFLLNNFYSVNLDFYNSKNLESVEKNTIRALPEVGLQYQYPLIKMEKDRSRILEPIIQLMLSPDDNKSKDIKNEDSLETELTSSNLFEENKYSGFDRLEKGFRANYGVLYKINNNSGSSITSSLGRSYHNNKQDDFNEKNGFKNNDSEIVGNLGFTGTKNSEIYYKFRFSEDLELKKNRIKTNFHFLNTDFQMSFMQIRDFTSSNNSDTEQLTFGITKRLFRNWELSISQFRDLASAKYSSPLRSSLGASFENECLSFTINLTKDKSNAVDIPASTNLSFTFDLFSM